MEFHKDDYLKFVAFPVIVGIVIVLFQFAIDRYKATRKVSALIEGPFALAQINELFENAKLSFDVESTGEVKGEGRWEGEASEEKDKEKDEEKDLVQDKKEIPKPQKPLKSVVPLKAPTNVQLRITGISIEMKDLKDLQVYKLTIRNTGNLPIRDLPIRFVFENASDQFKVLSVKHKTNPTREFGEIKSDFSESSSPRFVYQLLNPGDEDVLSILAFRKGDLKVYSKGEGVSFDVTSASEIAPGANMLVNVLYATVFVLLGVIMGIFWTYLIIRRNRTT